MAEHLYADTVVIGGGTAGPAFDGFCINVGDDLKNRSAWRIPENQGDIPERYGMRSTHTSDADKPNPYIFHRLCPFH